MESRLTRPIVKVMLLQQFLFAIRQILSKFFISQQECAEALRQSAFLPITSPAVD